MISSVINFLKKGGLLFVLLLFMMIINHRTGYITLVTFFSLIVFATITIKKSPDKYSILIIIFEFMLFTISRINGHTYDISSMVIAFVAPVFFYQFGYYLSNRYKTDNNIIIAWLAIITCYCIDIFIISTNNIITTGTIIGDVRNLSFEGTGYSLAATLVGLHMDIGMIGLPMSIIDKKSSLRIVFFTLFFLSLLTTIHLLNRTGLIIAIMVLFILIGYKSRKNPKIIIISTIGILMAYAILTYFGIISNDLISLYAERNENIATMGNRSGLWEEAIGNILIHPLGWSDGSTYYVHNMWLDVARMSGIIPFIILLYLTLDTFKKSYKLLKRNETTIAYFILGLNICFFASCFVEPIYGGTHVNLYFMLMGTVNYLVKNRQRQIISSFD